MPRTGRTPSNKCHPVASLSYLARRAASMWRSVCPSCRAPIPVPPCECPGNCTTCLPPVGQFVASSTERVPRLSVLEAAQVSQAGSKGQSHPRKERRRLLVPSPRDNFANWGKFMSPLTRGLSILGIAAVGAARRDSKRAFRPFLKLLDPRKRPRD